MATLLARNAALLIGMDDEQREIADGTVFCRGEVIEHVGVSGALPTDADRVLGGIWIQEE